MEAHSDFSSIYSGETMSDAMWFSTETASVVLLHGVYSIIIYSVDLTFESVNEILRCEHSAETPFRTPIDSSA